MNAQTPLERFLNVMEYKAVDSVPNWEAGVWTHTRERWENEGLDATRFHWDWFSGEASLGFDPREFILFRGGMIPPFDYEVLEEDAETELFRDAEGRLRRALKKGVVKGMRTSMDTYLRFPVETMEDWQKLKKRYNPSSPQRYEPNWQCSRPVSWKARQHPLIFGPNCSTGGFYWMARNWMGTENLSYAWYDQPDLMHDMMTFWGDFLIETGRPILEHTTLEYICLSEDLSMRNGPLLSPDTYRTFIFPHLKRVIEFYKSHGCRYVCVDTDGDPQVLIPQFLDAGVDSIWPMERASDQDPLMLRKKFGRSLRLWGGVDKRELALGPKAIDAHLRSLAPLIEEGGFIPTVDHLVSPEVSWDNFQYYLEQKSRLLRGELR